MKQQITFFVAALLLLNSFHIHAEQKQTLGNWDVHFSAFGSTFLSPEVATIYNINRSRNTGIITLSILDKNTNAPQDVTLKASARNLLGVYKTLDFKQIKEGNSIYYITDVSYRNEEMYRVEVIIKQGKESQTLKFQHTFYVE